MDIDKAIKVLNLIKNSGATQVFIDKASIVEGVATEFRGGTIWLDGYNSKGIYVASIELEVEEEVNK